VLACACDLFADQECDRCSLLFLARDCEHAREPFLCPACAERATQAARGAPCE